MSAMRQRNIFLLLPFTQVLWNPVRKIWIFSWKKIIYITESEIKFFSFCIYVAFDMFLYKHSLIVIQWIGNQRLGNEQFIPIGMQMTCGKMCPLNSTNMIVNSNILITSFSVYHFLHFVPCLRKEVILWPKTINL